jgi:hypothetical protein
MSGDLSLLAMLAVFFFATFIRSAFGFGEALVAVPLLALMMPIEVAAPVAVLVSITIAAIVVAQDWRDINFRSVGWLSISTLFGVPLGLFLLVAVDERLVQAILAVVIIGFSAYCLRRQTLPSLKDDRLAPVFGFCAGVLGGAYGMNGPPLVIYGSLRGWSPQRFRATLQGYFLPASLMGMGGYWFAGLWTQTVTSHFIKTLPAVVIAVFLGRAVNRRLSGRSFIVYVHVSLLIVGSILFWQSVA